MTEEKPHAECRNCRFWRRSPNWHDEGTCRINPPDPTGFPRIAPDQWCGKHEPKEPQE